MCAGVRRTGAGSSQPSRTDGPKLDYYCYTLGPDGARWTYVNDFIYSRAGWARNTMLPNNGSTVYCGK